ncbi:ROK family protein [Cryobacterium adonitolivorans]|uniref:ROK family protein n=1 Tax=Cryobacterium adonitolivorans TaxID=1259189 RepID=A0A4R8W3L8_9MICO|nr:ROK family protein [Cryobacterium adonitolivorans]TFC01059.1 ROK family protein [Cryobacterium adonitolivorans]
MSPEPPRPPGVFVGVDLGGTATRFVVTDARLRVLDSYTASTPSNGSEKDLTAFFVSGISKVAGARPLTAIGVGASGPIDRDGVIQNPDTLPAFTGADIPGILTDTFHLPSFIENDAVTAALGEAVSGAGRGFDTILMVTLGTGIGVSMLQGGKPVRGADGQHPEAGHLSIGGPAAPCYCGRTTCWEQAASRQALQRASTGQLPHPSNTSDDIRAVADLASTGDRGAIELLDSYGLRLADGLATLLTIYRPEILVLGGSGATYLPHYRRSLTASLDNLTDTFPRPTITGADFGEYGGAIGAAALARTGHQL